jgi:hypothetical protein
VRGEVGRGEACMKMVRWMLNFVKGGGSEDPWDHWDGV